MKLNNNTKIIHEDDIILSDGAQSLSDRLSSYSQQIEKLTSNVKWLYKYGGIGGSGGSGGGGATQSFSIYAQLNGVQLKDQSIVLDGPKLYTLSIKINNPNGAQFNVKYSYITKSSTGNDIKQEQTVILSIENNYELETQINLNTNSNLSITVSDGNETKQVMCSYVVFPYEFNLYLVDDNGDPVLNEHFIETAAKKGISVKLVYTVSINANIHYKYTFNKKTTEGDITDRNNTILFPIDKSLFTPDQSGYYTANIDLDIIPDGQELVKLNKSISFSLIPEDLYMLLQPTEGVIYDKEISSDQFLYTPGYLTFNYRIYEGLSQNRTYTINILLNDSSIINQSVIERQQYTFKLFTVTPGLNTIEVVVSRTTTYRKKYYFYVQETSLSLDWFDSPTQWTSYYYRINETTENFEQYRNKLYIQQTVNTPPIKFTGMVPPDVASNAIINTHVAIGIQYNTINSEDPIILNFSSKESAGASVLSIQQSHVNRQGQQADLYIKKQSNADKDRIENYHLIQIYSQYVRRIGNEFYYEMSLYIDGILESEFGQIVNYPLVADSLQIEPVNCYINLIEIDYKPTDEKRINNCDYEVYKFYLKYKNAILRQEVGQELLLVDYLKNFQVGLDGRVTINQADISNIAKNIDTPVLLATYQDNGEFDSAGGFMAALEKGYGEDGSGIGSDMNFQVSISWSPGKNSVDEVQFPSGFRNARFRFKLQGSSTKNYRVKNFNLIIENTTGTEQDDIYLFSPNFQEGNPKSFLPETEFTLKADVVDSSHSNNTSCGRFVNTVCRKFSEDITEDGYYKPYIKNCLDGFPTLLYICHVKEDALTGELKRTYYYMGVYNFNLGRSSYYNLGYKDLSVFGTQDNKLLTNAGNSFSFFKVSPAFDKLKEGLGVAEIQGGDPHFDFSQWDPTVLFQQVDTDQRYMFGDLVYGSNGTEQQLKTNISKFVEKVAKSGGYLFDFLKKKRGPYETDDVKEGAGYNAEVYDEDGNPTGESKNQVPDYTKQYTKRLSPSGAWEFVQKTDMGTIKGTELDLKNLVIPDVDTGKLASLNFQSVSEYYTICMVLGLVDSVMKNLNIKTWNSKPDGTATWYPAFYDMDTCLGINNQGNPISYFAFSDYWHSQIKKTVNEVEYPSAVQIYRDFSPHALGENGYDVPTNYLFTVAKYAKLIFSDNQSEEAIYLSQYPQELYAKWRSNVENPKTHEGILKNADVFMENFFANNLAAICPALVSYNYRSKYLKLATENDTTWVSTDFNKFNGTRVNKVRDWLEGRLHILDVYFNLNRAMPQAITYRTDLGKWETLMVGSAPVTDTMYSSNYSLADNEDVVILKDIFSANGGAGVQLSGYVSFQIRCPEFSPLQIYNAIGSIHENFILGGSKNQQVEFTPTGVQTVKLGGSQAWSYLQDINWITTSGLYITSDKLENITGSAGKFTSLSLHTPNVKTISLTSRNYSGRLELNGTNNYPNLSSIDISGSQINLIVNDLNIKSLNIGNMNAPNSEVKITNCKSITSLNTSRTRLRSLHIEGLKGSLKDFSLSETNINSITVKAGETGGTFTLSDDLTVTQVTVQDFQKVVIQNCPKLNRVTINGKIIQDIEELQILNCQADNMSITSGVEHINGRVNLTTAPLKRVKFSDTVGIIEVELPNDVQLMPRAFYKCRNLTTISGNRIKLEKEALYECTKYAMLNKDGSRTDFVIEPTLEDISGAFYGTALTWQDVKHIIDVIVPVGNSLTNVSKLFSFCGKIVFTLSDLQQSITQNNYPNFTKLNKVTDATYLFYSDGNYEGIQALNKNIMQMGSPAGCDYYNLVYNKLSAQNLYVPKNIFSNGVITKVIRVPFGTWNGAPNKITFVDDQGTPLNTSTPIKLAEIFNPNGTSPIKMISLDSVVPYNTYTFDWTGVFTAAWVELRKVAELCGYACKYIGYENILKNVPNPIEVYYSWGKSLVEDYTADYFNMYNWDNQVKLSTLFVLDSLRRTEAHCNGCAKYISAENYTLLCEKILKSTTVTNINAIFRNTTVVGSLGDFTFGRIPNAGIKKAVLAFENFKNKPQLTAAENIPLMLNPDFCKTIPMLENVLGMFRYCKFGKPIPFNFFQKRQEIAEDVWVPDVAPSTYKPATLYTYSYSNRMYNMSNLFEGCEWSTDSLQYSPELYTIPRSRVWDGKQEHQEYYTRIIIQDKPEIVYQYIKHEVKQPTEITDAEGIKGGYVAKITGTSIINPTITGSADKLIIPPDLFYGLAPNISNTEEYEYSYGVYRALYCKTPLNGIIPSNVFKSNRNVRCTDTWKDQIIIPQLVSTWTSDNSTYNVYVHYPKQYTNYGNLDEAFNSEYIVLGNFRIGDATTINYSLVLLQDSIPSAVSSLSYAFKGKTKWTAFGQSLEPGLQEFNFIGNLGHEQVILGLDPSHFSQLNMDYMFYSDYLQVVNGNLFVPSFDAAFIKMANKVSRIMDITVTSGWPYDSMASTMIMPKATGPIAQLASDTPFKLKVGQIIDSTTSKRYYTQAGWNIIEI